jgi:hypothetical protein
MSSKLVFWSIFSVIMGILIVTGKSRIKTKWNIQSDRDYWLIMLSYSLAGMFILPAKKFVFHLVGINDHTPFWVVALVYIPLIPPVYQMGLLFFGSLLGQFDFVWGQAKKRGQLIKRIFGRA